MVRMINSQSMYKVPKGFSDRPPAEYLSQLSVMNKFFELTKSMGFEPMHVSPVSFTSTFNDNREVTKDWTYRFNDKKGRDLVLNPDSLPPLLRAYTEQYKQTKEPTRWSFCTPIFRYKKSNWEKRYRFHLGATLINAKDSIYYDYLIATIPIKFLESVINIKPILKSNDFYIWRELFKAYGIDHAHAQQIFYKVRSATKKDFMHFIDSEVGSSEFTNIVTALADRGIIDSANTFELELKDILPVSLHKRINYLVRYSDMVHRQSEVSLLVDFFDFHAAPFHDGIAFKVLSDTELPRIGDGGSNHTQGHSYSSCIDTVYSVALNWEAISYLYNKSHVSNRHLDVYIASENLSDELIDIIKTLRSAGLTVWESLNSKNISKEMKYAVALESQLFLTVTESDSKIKIRYLHDYTDKTIEIENVLNEVFTYFNKGYN